MPKILSNDELKKELQVDYSTRTVYKKAAELRLYNIKAFNSIDRTNLEYGKKEKRVLLYSTLKKEHIYIQYPGKESIGSQEMPLDFRPELKTTEGEFISDISFGTIWDILDKIGKEHNAYLCYVAAIFLRLGYMHEYEKEDGIYKSFDICFEGDQEKEYSEASAAELSWYRLNLSEDVWYTLNDRIGEIVLDEGKQISFEAFIKLVDLLFQNEDCKYYYKNVVMYKKENYNLKNGRTNSSAANLLILNYLEGNEKISKLLDAFQKSRGVPAFAKRDYSIVTNGIVINFDVEKRE